MWRSCPGQPSFLRACLVCTAFVSAKRKWWARVRPACTSVLTWASRREFGIAFVTFAFEINVGILSHRVFYLMGRREHLSPQDIKKNKAEFSLLKKGKLAATSEPVEFRPSLPTPPLTVTYEQYFSEPPNPACAQLGRPMNISAKHRSIKPTVWMSEAFDGKVEELILLAEALSPAAVQLERLREFLRTQLPPGFPVKLEVPVFPTISAQVSFNSFVRNPVFADATFTIPVDYALVADDQPVVALMPEEENFDEAAADAQDESQSESDTEETVQVREHAGLVAFFFCLVELKFWSSERQRK
eukprot:m.348882 g.348882  ORF g.348882 m.348882 type:complete len:301 (-) comp55878_c0_seq1:1599-2501(-)